MNRAERDAFVRAVAALDHARGGGCPIPTGGIGGECDAAVAGFVITGPGAFIDRPGAGHGVTLLCQEHGEYLEREEQFTVVWLEARSTVLFDFVVRLAAKPQTGNDRFGHWGARARVTKANRSSTAEQAAQVRRRLGTPIATEKVRLHLVLIRWEGQKELDQDNLYQALKPSLDGLVDAGWLVKDTKQWLTYTADQEFDPEVGPAVRVEIHQPGTMLV